jgi:hypothetical protein
MVKRFRLCFQFRLEPLHDGHFQRFKRRNEWEEDDVSDDEGARKFSLALAVQESRGRAVHIDPRLTPG